MKKLLFLLAFILIGQLHAQSCFFGTTTFTVGNNNAPYTIASEDFNGDGKKDLVAISGNSNTVSILLGNGAGNFGAASSFTVNGVSSVCSADFDGDGKKDLAVGTQDSVAVLLGTGSGSFGSPLKFAVGTNPGAIISADFNEDGIFDLATANYATNNVSILLGLGGGIFGTALNHAVGTAPSSLISMDLNANGHLDLAVANENSSNVSILMGTGTGSFGAALNYVVGAGPRSITSADFNNDNKVDLAVVNTGSGNFSLLLGNGLGGFGSAINTYAGSNPTAIASYDFDFDGKADVAVADAMLNQVSIFLGTGTGGFAPIPAAYPVGNFPKALICVNFNGDSKKDLAAVNITSSDISVMINCASCVATITDSLFNISPLNWGVLTHYSPLVTSAVWSWGDGTFTNGLYPSHTYTTSGWYHICATAYSSCGDSASTCFYDTLYKVANNNSMVNINVVSSLTGIDQTASNNNRFFIYPNPTSDQFTIETNTTEKLIANLYDINGRHMFNKTVNGKTTIDVTDLNEGVYTLIIKTPDRVINKKLVIVH